MQYLSEVLKILDGALKANAGMASNYAGLLADKLDQEGERQQARQLRERLARVVPALVSAQDAGHGVSMGQLPTDNESRLNTVDVSRPQSRDIDLVLPDAIQGRLDEFLQCVRHHDQLVRAGAALPNRVLIYGPPGTGKTQTARWLSGQLELPLLTVRCDTLVSSLLGQTSRNLRRVFDYAEQTPSVLFLDEFDALAGARGNERDVGELQRVVIALLQNIDALPDSTILVAATNHEQLLDAAIGRRFAFHIPMPLPDASLRTVLWQRWLGSYAPASIDWDELSDLSSGATGAVIEHVCMDVKRTAILSGQALIDKNELYRRLGLTQAMASQERLSTTEQEIVWLRQWAPEHFSLRALAGMYNLSTRKITSIIQAKKGGSHGNKKGVGRR
ncbi:anti-phage ATPase IteA [Polaromonas sp.]|uniref:anti-phage ATPase IteA n=1 Tax=Polaromonas sp. TaxID=1869339 RepID=UPI00260107DA|nr:anti-phage ATPase IteA [Polaromonas sp.]